MKIFPVILAGGTGSRLWPLSRTAFPKQFLPLISESSMLQETLARLSETDYRPPTVICNQEHRFLVAEHIRAAGRRARAIILEENGRGTAFAIGVGALSALAEDPGALILVLPCDHAVDGAEKLNEAVLKAKTAAARGRLVVFGVEPEVPHAGYGYINLGANAGGIYDVKEFTEKPDTVRAAEFLKAGTHLWNAGIFLFGAKAILDEIEKYAPLVHKAVQQSWNKAAPDLDFIRLPPGAVQDCPSISIDYAILEKSAHVSCVKLDAGWADLGSWAAVYDRADKDESGNFSRGDVVAVDTKNSIVQAGGAMTVATLGVENLAVIADEDAVLVADLSRAQDVMKITAALDKSGSDKHARHPQIWRPWGNYKILGQGPGYIIKRLSINPGAALSLQYHNHRSEHWVVVRGQVDVRRGEESLALKVNESVYIPIGARHSIANNGTEAAELIEVQTGDILTEEDIVRLEDRYRRI